MRLPIRSSQHQPTAKGRCFPPKTQTFQSRRILLPGHSNCCLACASCARAMDASARPDGRTQAWHASAQQSWVARQQCKPQGSQRGQRRNEGKNCSRAKTTSMCLFNCLLRLQSPQMSTVQATRATHQNDRGESSWEGKQSKQGKQGKHPNNSS